MIKKKKQVADKSNEEIIEQLNKANYLYSFLSQVNKNIVRINNENVLYRNSCNIALEFGKFKTAWIGLFDHNKQTITMVDHCGFPGEYIDSFKNATYNANGPQYHVLKTGSYYVCNDIFNEPELKNWWNFSVTYDIGSCLVLPIRKDGIIIGTFNLYAREKNFSGKEEIILLEEIAENISFALDRFERAKKYQEAESIIKNNEKRFRALIENASEMTTLSTREGKVLYASPSIAKHFGYDINEVPFIFKKDFIHPDDDVEFKKKRKGILKLDGASFFKLLRLKHKNGGWIWCELTMENRLNEEGVNALVTHTRDVTGKMIVESEKEFDRQNFNTLINNTTDLMWSLDTDFNLLTSNKPFDNAILAAGKLIRRGENVFSASLSFEQENRFRAYYQRAFAGESFTLVEENNEPVYFCIEISFSPIWNSNEVVGVACHSRDITQRKKAEAEIIKVHEEKETVLNRINDGVISVDNNWRYTFLNDAAMVNHTQDKSRLIGKVIWDVHPAMKKTIFWDRYHEAMSTKKVVEVEDYHTSTDVWFSVKVYPSSNGLTIFYKNVSERKKAEQKIIKSNRLYHFLSNFNKSIVHVNNEHDLLDKVCSIAIEIGEFKLAYVGLLDGNEKLSISNFFGDRDGLQTNQNQSVMDVNDPTYKHTPTVKAIKSSELSFNNDMQNDPDLGHLRAELILRDIHSSISLPVCRFGKVIGIFGLHSSVKNFFDIEEIKLLEEAVMDISFALENFEKERQHKETEDLVLKNEKRFRALIENSMDMITLTNSEGNFIYASPSITRIFGYKMEEFMYRSAFDFFHPEDVIDLIKQRTNILDTPGKSFDFQYRILHKNNQWVWCEGTITNMFHEPAINAMVSNFREITEKIKAEKEKEKMIVDIVQRSKNLEQFAYIVSHNLRAPVCSIKGLANIIQTGLSEMEKNRVQQYLFQSVDQLDEITKDLNKILRSGSESIEIKELVNFTELVEAIKLSAAVTIEKENVVIKTNFVSVDSVIIVKTYIQSIFYNLISNSIKYKMPLRKLMINIRSEQCNEKIKLFFSDNGSGIDLNMHGENVFGLYKRFHPEIEGKGLGLFMVKTQVESIGGSISITSEPKYGTEFIIELPNK